MKRSPSPSTGWSCQTCTFVNDDELRRCQVCETFRAKDDWACTQCTLVNAADAPLCVACDTLAPGRQGDGGSSEPKRSRSLGAPVTLQVRLPSGERQEVTAGALFENSTLDELHRVVEEQFQLSPSFLITVPYPFPGQPLERRQDQTLKDWDLAPKAVITVVDESAPKKKTLAPAPVAPRWADVSVGGYVHSSYQPPSNESQESLSILSLNVWFEPHYFDLRCAEQLRYFTEQECDVLCLQEVTQAYLVQLLGSPWLRSRYWVSHRAIESYGVVLMSRRIPTKVSNYVLPSNMGRSLLVAEIGSLIVSTVHLESMADPQQVRCKQLRIIMDALSNRSDALVCGDFNFDSDETTAPEHSAIDSRFVDIGPRAPTLGVNYGSKKYKAKRYDRMLLKSVLWTAESSVLFGQRKLIVPPGTPIPEKSWIQRCGAFLSDHAGLLIRLKMRK